jgi:signal transduction histidine kinase
MPIGAKLGLILIVPTVATVLVGVNGLVTHLGDLDRANRARALADLTEASGALVHELQDERAAAVLLLGAAEPAAREKYLAWYEEVGASVNRAADPYTARRGNLTDLPTNFTNLLDRIDQSLADLPSIRSQVVNTKLKLTDAAQTYEGLITDLLDIRDSAAQLSGDTELSERMRAVAATARAKEFLAIRRVVVHRAIIQDSLVPALRWEYIATETGQQQALQSFHAVATRAEAEFYAQTVAGSEQREADNYSGWIRGKVDDSMRGAPFDADRWDTAMAGNARLIRTVEAKLDGDVRARAIESRDAVQRQVLVETSLLLGMLLLAILFAWIVARSMARSLRELKKGAFDLAKHGLPQAVARLRDPQLITQMSPVQVANQIAEPLPVRSRDEFGQLTEAFNAVHLEAVRTAAEQAALRSSVATMFVNLARRSQILVDRLISHLDRLERGEEDPDRLAELFQLDHLATRMRRNDENLLVLAGADSTRIQREPAALMDVLRAAQSEVEHYTRIEFGVVDRDLEVAAHAVNDLVHLVAELLDNATAFSPPDSQVMVEARWVGDDAVLYVEDRGIGISPTQLRELNERLASPPTMDVTVSRMMGLVVVARLAARHKVRVELRAGTQRGTVADVTLPGSVLVSRASDSRVPRQSGFVPLPQPAGALPPAPTGASSTPEGAPASGSGRFGAAPSATTPIGSPGYPPARTPYPPSRGSLFDPPVRSTPAAPGAVPPYPGARQAPPPATTGGPAQRPNRDQPGFGAQPPIAPAQLPDWSELPGVRATRNRIDPFTPQPAEGLGAEPLPQRRQAQANVEPTSESLPQTNIPRQIPTTPEARSAGNLPGAPQFAAPPPAGNVPGTPPPAWPPVGTPEPAPSPAHPRPTADVTDITSSSSGRSGVSGTEAWSAPSNSGLLLPGTGATPTDASGRFADETVELPIFRELESAWFQTRRSRGEGSGASAMAPGGTGSAGGAGYAADMGPRENAGMTDTPNTGLSAAPTRDDGVPATSDVSGSRRISTTGGWRTAADEGWRAASAAANASIVETTQTGLPKRVPMAQLVPGGLEQPTKSVHRRTPEAVRGLLSAYHRGVQRGRSPLKDEHSTNPGTTLAGQGPGLPHGGPAAGSGQKEHEG